MKVLDPEKTKVVHNRDWIFDLDLADLLGLLSNFTVARILERDDFSNRYHSQQPHRHARVHLPHHASVRLRRHNADVELGGNDQLFNLLAGRELMEKKGMEPQVCLTLPLLEGLDGVRKMSKSYGNYVGLTDEPADMFGKIMSIPMSSCLGTTAWRRRFPWMRSTKSKQVWQQGSLIPTNRSVALHARLSGFITVLTLRLRPRNSSTLSSRRMRHLMTLRSSISSSEEDAEKGGSLFAQVACRPQARGLRR